MACLIHDIVRLNTNEILARKPSWLTLDMEMNLLNFLSIFPHNVNNVFFYNFHFHHQCPNESELFQQKCIFIHFLSKPKFNQQIN